jgi:class 3 adenylate cyclase
VLDSLDEYTGRYSAALNGHTAGSIDRCKALCCAALGRFDEAASLFASAMRVDEEFCSWVWLPRTQCDFAEVLLERDGPGDSARALELLRKSLDASERLGLKGWLDRALAIKLRTQGVDSRSVAHSIYVVAESIAARRPDLTPHTSPEGEVTLMLSDMKNFTEMTVRLGDHAAREIVREHNRIIREQLEVFEGHEVDTAGDGFLVAFKSPADGIRCAVAIQQALEVRNASAAEPIRIRIGLHTGEALKDADKFFGRTVILAARIGGTADGGQILVSALVRQLVEGVGNIRFGDARDVALKGISESQTVVDVLWQ